MPVNTPVERPPVHRRPWWQSAPVLSLAAVLLLLGLTLAWAWWRGAAQAPGPTVGQGLPWQVQVAADGGSEVFGLRLGRTTADEAMRRFGDDLRLSLVERSGQPPALEAYVETFQAGFIGGKLVLAFDADPAWLQAAAARATRSERGGDDGLSRFKALAEADLPQARQQPVAALAFLPMARLDAQTVVQRFGPPAERLTGPAGEQQLLYPGIGLAAVLPPAEGPQARARPVLQYVAPRDFEPRLRAPLLQAAAASAAR